MSTISIETIYRVCVALPIGMGTTIVLTEGMPYQTLITSTSHKSVTG